MLVAVTGTPCTGKSHFARLISRKIGNAKTIEINYIVNKYRAFSRYDKFGTKIVKLGMLTKALKKEIKNSKSGFIVIVGHLAPELGIRFDIAIVLRSRLARLELLMRKRGYQKQKIKDNIFSEAVDYCGETIKGKSSELYEIETEKEKGSIIKYLKAVSENVKAKKPSTRDISKMGELLSYLNSGRS